MRSADELLEELRAVDESSTIEAKSATKIDRSILETVCAFANEPGFGGGHLLLGVSASTQLGLFTRVYDVSGVVNPDQLQADLATQCATIFNKPIRPQLQVEVVDGRTVVVAYIAELAPTEKPLFSSRSGYRVGRFVGSGPPIRKAPKTTLLLSIRAIRETATTVPWCAMAIYATSIRRPCARIANFALRQTRWPKS